MAEFFDIIGQASPYLLPVLAAIGTIIFTKNYVYKDMIPESMLARQLSREHALLADQVERERNIVEVAKNLENRLEEIVKQLESLTKRVSEEVRENNDRIASLERYLSDQLEAIRELAYNCEKHRKGIPDTAVFRKE